MPAVGKAVTVKLVALVLITGVAEVAVAATTVVVTTDTYTAVGAVVMV
jgi:hypothetical protein